MSTDALLREALARLADRADEYRHAVAEANRYLNEDLPSAKALVFALGSARSALRRLVDEYDEDMGRPPSFTSMDEARTALAAMPPASADDSIRQYADELFRRGIADLHTAMPPASAERDAVVKAAKAVVDAIAVDEGWPETVANVVKAEIALSKAVDALRAAEARDEH
jgi:hypothetical protein